MGAQKVGLLVDDIGVINHESRLKNEGCLQEMWFVELRRVKSMNAMKCKFMQNINEGSVPLIYASRCNISHLYPRNGGIITYLWIPNDLLLAVNYLE